MNLILTHEQIWQKGDESDKNLKYFPDFDLGLERTGSISIVWLRTSYARARTCTFQCANLHAADPGHTQNFSHINAFEVPALCTFVPKFVPHPSNRFFLLKSGAAIICHCGWWRQGRPSNFQCGGGGGGTRKKGHFLERKNGTYKW